MAEIGSGVKECWYTILGVERTASPEAIRTAYRKEALRWHPDKIQQSGASVDECQQATARFQKIVQAYEVLSNSDERAWYDKYRSEILSSGGASKDFEFNVFSFFSPSSFSGYGNSGKGFYKVYNDVFSKIHKKEQAFARAYGLGPLGEAPSMGNPSTPYTEVEGFYKYWTGFTTVKDFSWCDEFQLSQAPNRKAKRMMEDENAKIRKRERREYNDAVRDLATFVKQRDKRWVERKLELQRLQKEKEENLKLRNRKLQQEKIAKARAMQEQEWSKLPDSDFEDDAIEDINEGSYDWKGASKKAQPNEENYLEFYCIACSKRFRSEMQWKNHEKSKKHIERALFLKQSLLSEDEQADTLVMDLDLEIDTEKTPEEYKTTAGDLNPAWGVKDVETAELADQGNIGDDHGESVPSFGDEVLGGRRKESSSPGPSTSSPQQKDANKVDDSESEEVENPEVDGGETLETLPKEFSPGPSISSLQQKDAAANEKSDEVEDLEEDDEDGVLAAMINSRKSRQAVTPSNIGVDVDLEDDTDNEVQEVDDDDSVLSAMIQAERNENIVSPEVDVSIDLDVRENIGISGQQGVEDLQSDTKNSGGIDANDESDVLPSIGKSQRGKECFSPNEQIGRDVNKSKEVPIRGSEETILSSKLGKSNSKRKSKLGKQRVAVRERHADLVDELSTCNITEVIQGQDSVKGTGNVQFVVDGKKKKLQRGQKSSNPELAGKQRVPDVVAQLLQQSEVSGKKGSAKGKKGKGVAKPTSIPSDACGEDFDSK